MKKNVFLGDLEGQAGPQNLLVPENEIAWWAIFGIFVICDDRGTYQYHIYLYILNNKEVENVHLPFLPFLFHFLKINFHLK